MPAPKRINSEFEGKTLATLTYQGRPCWIARDIGRVLDYSRDGRRLVAKIAGKWSYEFIEGHDYAVLRGDELEEFKASLLVGATGTMPSRYQRSLMLLFESGLHLALNLTFKPAGLRLRRFLMDEVLPRMTGRSRPWPSQTPRNVIFAPHRGRPLDRKAIREQRLLAQYELSRRVFQSESLRRTVQTLAHLGRISDDQAQTYEVLATEIALGTELPGLRIGSPFGEVANQARQRIADDILRDARRRARRSAMEAALEQKELATAYPGNVGGDWPTPDDDADGPSDDDSDPSPDPCSE
jgi:prophage antirepressor-like protein